MYPLCNFYYNICNTSKYRHTVHSFLICICLVLGFLSNFMEEAIIPGLEWKEEGHLELSSHFQRLFYIFLHRRTYLRRRNMWSWSQSVQKGRFVFTLKPFWKTQIWVKSNPQAGDEQGASLTLSMTFLSSWTHKTY